MASDPSVSPASAAPHDVAAGAPHDLPPPPERPSRIKPVAWTLAALVVVGLIVWPKLREDEGGEGGPGGASGGGPGGARAGQAGGGRGGPGGGGGGRPVTASYALVASESIGDTLVATGTLVPWEEVQVNAEVAGRIVALNLPEGAYVRQGQALATLDTRVLAAQTQALQTQLDLARTQAGRLRQLFAIGGLSQQALDEAEGRVRVLEAQVEQQRAETARRTVVAPFSGRLGFRAVSVGAYVSPGQALTTLRVTNPLRLEFAVPERYAGQVRPGATVEFRLPGQPTPVLGSVYAFEPAIYPGTRTFLVRARVGNAGDVLQPGAFAEVKATVGSRENALVVPTTALVPGLDSAAVFTVRSGKARRIAVLTGTRTRDRVEVIGQVAPGDTVLTSSFDELRPGASVSLARPDGESGGPSGGATRSGGAGAEGARPASSSGAPGRAGG